MSEITRIIRPPQIFQKSFTDIIPEELQDKYGIGLDFPVNFNDETQEWDIASGYNKIRISQFIILSTPIGTRLDQPDFGSLLPHRVFSLYNDNLKSELYTDTKIALDRWEPRAIVEDVIVDDSGKDNNELRLIIKNLIIGVRAHVSFTFPFNLSDGRLVFMPNTTFTIDGRGIF